MRWLLDPTHRDAIVAQHNDLASYIAVDAIAAAIGCDADAVLQARDGARMGPRLDVVDGVAHISVQGPLLDEPYWVYDAFGIRYSDYQTISTLVSEAEASGDVQRIELDVDSPGGMVRGVFAAADIIKSATKPVDAIVSGMAASAGYLLASQADRIIATDRADEFGSIGVAIDAYVSPRLVSVASTDAPNKRPDLATEQGRAAVREHLDQIHQLFVDAVVDGRGVSVSTVNERFGRGGLLLTERALAAGMIDEVREADLGASVASACAADEAGATVTDMNRETFAKEHPELFAAVIAEGREQERKRVEGHLKIGEKIGAIEVAVAEIKDPDSDPVTSVAYQLHLATRKLAADRIEGNPEAKGSDAPATDDAELDSLYLDVMGSLVEDPTTITV